MRASETSDTYMEPPTGERTCKVCLETKSVDDFFWNYNNYRKKYYVRYECKVCHGKISQARNTKSRIRARLRDEIALANARAILRMMQYDPLLFEMMVRKHPTRFSNYLEEERKKGVERLKVRTLRSGKSKAKYTDHEKIFAELEEEMAQGKIPDRVARVPLIKENFNGNRGISA